MHAAEDDEFGIGLRGETRQFERVAGQVGVLVNVGALVVVAEDDGALAQLGAGGADAFVAVLVGQGVERVEGDGGCLHGCSLNRAGRCRPLNYP